jgi:hypothetical protein
MKSCKSPGGDGIISDFYQLYWKVNEKDFVEVVNDHSFFYRNLAASA